MRVSFPRRVEPRAMTAAKPLSGLIAVSFMTSGALAGASPPAPFETSAPIAYLVDLSSGAVLFDKQGGKAILPASMTKMMTAYIIFDLIEKGEVKLDQTFAVKPETWKIWQARPSASTMYLNSGDKVSVEQLLGGALTLSGNDACATLAEGIAGNEAAFAKRMNATAAKLGLKDSHFGTVTGWPDEGKTKSTAHDLAALAVATIRDHPALYKRFYGQPSFSWRGATHNNRDPILGRVPGADGLKTGHTNESGYSFTGSALHDGRRLVMVVAGMPSENGRLTESVRLMDWGYRVWATKPLFKAGTTIGTAKVQLGDMPAVSLVTENPVAITRPRNGTAPAKVVFRYQGPIKAPIAKGQHIADLVVTTPGLSPQIMPLVAGNAVGKAGFVNKVLSGLLSLFGR